ncbi:MAG: CRISPR system precrRNA processing endoribonuclease RAMP protein Cas6 [Candidatus Methylomirabilales bacterium]
MEEQIYFTRYRFSLQALEELDLPEYIGSTLRGGFGHVFRRIACPARKGEECPIPQQCPYHLIFETAPPPDAPALRNLEDIPRPFVIAPPPASERRTYRPGETLNFHLTLIGKACDFFPYFVVAFKELGAVGLGRGRGLFRLQQIEVEYPLAGQAEPVYSVEDEMVRNVQMRVSLKDCCAYAFSPLWSQHSALPISFLTPVRLKREGQFVDLPEFHIVFRTLLRRLSSLAIFHCGVKLDIDYRGLIAEAEKVKLIQNGTAWHDWQRYSSRQREKMFFGGLVGEAVYEGDLCPFLPYLLFGQWTHVGKNATFGLGAYRIGNGAVGES